MLGGLLLRKEHDQGRRNIKRSILESLTSGLRPAAAALEEVQEAQQKFGNKMKDVKTGADLFNKEIVVKIRENMRKARHLGDS